jgi:hypothetical protein
VVSIQSSAGTGDRGTNVAVDLGDGDDSLTLDAGLPPSRFSVDARGGDGNDSMSARVGNPLALSPADTAGRVAVRMNGGGGDDAIRSTVRMVSLNAPMALELNGGVGNDRIEAVFDHVTARAGLSLDVRGGRGDDDLRVVADSPSREAGGFDPSLVAESAVDLRVDGGEGADHVVGDITPCIEPQGSLALGFFGGGGDDAFDIAVNLEPAAHSPPSERDGPLLLDVQGDEGDDALNLTIGNYRSSTSPVELKLMGGRGKDTVHASPGIDTDSW